MILDILAEFDNATTTSGAWTAGLTVGSTVSTNSYDTVAAGAPAPTGADGLAIGGPLLHDIGRGRPVGLLVQVLTSFTSTGAATLEVDFVCATAATLAALTVLERTAPIAVASLSAPATTAATVLPNGSVMIAGGSAYRWNLKTVPAKVPQEFVGLQYVIGTASFSGGALEGAMVFNSAEDHADVFGGA